MRVVCSFCSRGKCEDTGKLLYSGCSTVSGEDESLCVGPRTAPDADYTLFVSDGFVSLVGDSHRVPVKILRDTGASESFIRQAVLSLASDTDSALLIQGIGLHSFSVPLHRIDLNSGFVNGEVTIAVRPSLPVDGIDLILGNHLGHDCFSFSISATACGQAYRSGACSQRCSLPARLFVLWLGHR